MATPYLHSFALFRRFLLPAALLLVVAQAHAGLVAYYTFNETSGTTAADPFGNIGTLTNMTGSEWTTGKVGGALSFDGTDDFINLGSVASSDPLALAGSPFTIATWINPTFTGDSYQRLVDKSNGSYGMNGYSLGIGSGTGGDERGRLYLWVNNNVWRTVATDVVNANTWSHVAVTADGANYQYYVDGVALPGEFTSNSYNSPPATTTNMAIGNWNSSTIRNFNGSLDEVRIYNHALSASEVSALHAGAGAPEPAETFAFLGLLTAFGLGFREWRSRRKAKAA